MEVSEVNTKNLQRAWEGPRWERMWRDPWDVVGSWNIPSKYGPHGELFLFLIKKEPVILKKLVDFGHSVLLVIEELCATGLRLRKKMSSGACCVEEFEEHSVENLSLEVVEQGWSGGLICLFLDDRELARVPLSCNWALDLLCQEIQEAWWSMHCRQICGPLLQRLNVSPILEGSGM